jgi:PAS domain S-box-containing protein
MARGPFEGAGLADAVPQFSTPAYDGRPGPPASQREAAFRSIVDSQGELICRFRFDGTILFVNAAYAEACGSTPQALVGRSIWDFIPESERRKVQAALERLRPHEPQLRIENEFRTQAGERWILWMNQALGFDAQGRFLEAQATGVDITERKRSEQALARSAIHMTALYRLTDRLQRIGSVEALYDAALDAIMAALACERASILLFDEAGAMRFVAWRGLSERYRRTVEGHSPWSLDTPDPQPFGSTTSIARTCPRSSGTRSGAKESGRSLSFRCSPTRV